MFFRTIKEAVQNWLLVRITLAAKPNHETLLFEVFPSLHRFLISSVLDILQFVR